MTRSLKLAALLVIASYVGSTAAWACDGCCQCGNNCGVRKVCRLVCEKKKIETVCYGCECEDYCLPNKACRGCLNSEAVCTGDCDKDCCAQGPLCCLEWFDWSPTCAKMFHRKKLTKYIVVKEVPSYKWKVEEVCNNCCPDCGCDAGADGVQVERPKDLPEGDVAPPPPPMARSASFSSRRAK